MRFTVCWKWVARDGDPRWAGVSDADAAALEVALRLAEPTGAPVEVVTLGPPAADAVLRDAIAAGATRAVRIDAPVDLRSDAVAAALAEHADGGGWILCGDHSRDRGSGSVPAFIAAHLGAAQALGLVTVAASATADRATDVLTVECTRRLDAGRREQLRVSAPAVLSVEGAVADLRRAGLAATLAARTAVIDVVAGPTGPVDEPRAVAPYRPRARVLPPPAGDSPLERVRALTDPGGHDTHAELVVLDPAAAARRIVDALGEWGYLVADQASAQ